MVLEVDGESVQCLPSRVIRFSGDSTTFAQLVDGPVVDLGLMTVRDSVIGSMVVIADVGDVIESDVIVAVGDAVFEDENGEHYILESKDALLDVRGHQLVLLSGMSIAMKTRSF
jgi:environmental stress-induced protein Ves